MNLKEPTRKKRVHQQPQRAFPIPLSKNDKWPMYTAHLSASGTCIAHPDEMAAVYCMGFFGKGSLSRGFPCFGKRRFGGPPQVRERQWKRRRRWAEDVKKLETEPFMFAAEGSSKLDDPEDSNPCLSPSGSSGKPSAPRAPENSPKIAKTPEETSLTHPKNQDEKPEEELENKSLEDSPNPEKSPKNLDTSLGQANEPESIPLEDSPKPPEISEININIPPTNNVESPTEKNSHPSGSPAKPAGKAPTPENDVQKIPQAGPSDNPPPKKNPQVLEDIEIDEVLLDSTEDEEVCEIVHSGVNKSTGSEDPSQEVCFLDEELSSLKPDDFLDYLEFPGDKPEENCQEMLVLPDSDSDTENYLKNIKPRLETEGFPVTETLQLTFEETFFLMYGLGCLQVVNYDGQLFNIIEAWKHFNEQDDAFFSKYVVYHYFRSKGWVVKPGLKCSGDFVLYKKGPSFYHASYVVFIEDVDADSLLREDSKIRRDISWMNIHSVNRLAQSVAKELLIVQVLWPSTVPRKISPVPLEALSEFTVRELLIRRWNPNETCETIPWDDDEDEDDDSS